MGKKAKKRAAPNRTVSAREAGSKPARRAAKPRLLAGGNPQISKADGDRPVQAYIRAVSGWKQQTVRALDSLVTELVPEARKAVRWNSPFYGIAGRGWFMALHVFTRYVKVTFFAGTSLNPPPSGGSGKNARWVDLQEGKFDRAQLARWIKQASELPGWGKC